MSHNTLGLVDIHKMVYIRCLLDTAYALDVMCSFPVSVFFPPNRLMEFTGSMIWRNQYLTNMLNRHAN